MALTVIIPTANNPIDFAVLLMQLQCQSVLPQQIYVADNSEDQYAEKIALRYQFSVPIIVDKKVGTIYQSWNEGVRFASDHDVLILNDDIVIGKDFIKSLITAGNDQALTCPIYDGFPPTRQIREHYSWDNDSKNHKVHMSYSESKHVPAMRGWAFLLPRSVIKKVGLFDEQFQIWYGDKDYENRVVQANLGLIFAKAQVSHYGTSSYIKIDKEVFNKTNYEDQIKFEKKYEIQHEDLGWDKYSKRIEQIGQSHSPESAINGDSSSDLTNSGERKILAIEKKQKQVKTSPKGNHA